jgi:SAM-dependent methyltransferase
MRTTDPEDWNRLCDGPGGPGLVFRRGIGLALELSEAFIQPGRRWLDIGCGTGRLLGGLSGAGAAAAGIDLNPRMLALARRNAPSLPFAVARAGQLPFGVSTFDGVTATSVMGCVDEAFPVCAEIRRVLRPRGHALITFTNRDSWLLKLNYAFDRRRGEGYRLYGASEVVAALEGLGFDVLQLRFYNFVLNAGTRTFPPAGLARRLECAGPSRLASRLARNFIVVARAGAA